MESRAGRQQNEPRHAVSFLPTTAPCRRPIPPFACTNSIRTRMRCQMRELMPCLQVHARYNIAGRLREAKVNGELLCPLVFHLPTTPILLSAAAANPHSAG